MTTELRTVETTNATAKTLNPRLGGRNGALADVVEDHRSPVRALAVSPAGPTLASGDASGAVKLWDFRTRKPLFDLPHAVEHVEHCEERVLTADGTRLICRSDSHKLCEFTVAHKTPLDGAAGASLAEHP